MQFSSLPLSADLLKNLESLSYLEMTPIQAKSLPYILKNQDILAKAKTGSGKTAAFGLGLLFKVDPLDLRPKALVLCPTRELADQVSQEIRRLARLIPNCRVLTLCGGKSVRTQAESLSHGAHILVATPGRLQDHIERNTIDLKNIQTLVLDEADRMLDMGFFDTIMDIIDQLPKQRQTLLFSATYPSSIVGISRKIQNNPVDIAIEEDSDTPDIIHVAYQVREHEKLEALKDFLLHYNAQSAILFCKTKMQCDEVARKLCKQGIHALAIHSDLEQKDREEVLLQFANHSCSILVATDVAARGLDIRDLPLVVNYDLPSTPDVYVHRVGRTGRQGKSGVAVSLFPHAEGGLIEHIEKHTQLEMVRMDKGSLHTENKQVPKPTMRTLKINAGKKNKMRPGDILGALTKDAGIDADQVGKIDIFDFNAYVAIDRKSAANAFAHLESGKIKGRSLQIRFLDNF